MGRYLLANTANDHQKSVMSLSCEAKTETSAGVKVVAMSVRALVLFLSTLSVLFLVPATVTVAIAAESNESIRFAIMALTPYGYYAENGQPRGDHFDIATAILTEGGFQGEVVITPLKRISHRMFIEKTTDCSLFAAVPFVKDNYSLVEPIGIDLRFGFIPRKGVTINDYESLRGLRIGVPLGVHMGGSFDQDKTINKLETKDYETGMLMLKRSRFDAIAGVIGSLQFGGKRVGVDAIHYGIPWVVHGIPVWVACRPQFLDESMKNRLRNTVAKLRDNGTIKRITERNRLYR